MSLPQSKIRLSHNPHLAVQLALEGAAVETVGFGVGYLGGGNCVGIVVKLLLRHEFAGPKKKM